MNRTKRTLSAWLPATPCFPEMREQIVAVAERQGKSITAIQREAFALFLRQRDSQSISTDNDPIPQA